MVLKFATNDELSTWNKHILANPDGGNILQSAEMAVQRSLGGWTPRYILADGLALVALERSVPLLGKLWYVIKGPGVTTTDQLEALLPELRAFAAKNGVFAVKIEPEIIKTDAGVANPIQLGLVKVRNIQPNASTVFLDISPDLDTIIAGFNQKTRHAIRRAERDGATIKQVEASEENCQKMFDLYKTTAEGKFNTRSYDYHKHLWQSFETAGLGQMFFGFAPDGTLVAAAYAFIFGDKSTYKDGASLRERPVYGMSHLLQWRIIEWAKGRGAVAHDFCGAPPSDQIKNPDHPFYGFGRFKTSFNKEVTDFIGAYDLIIRPLPYRIWSRIGERVVLRLHRKLNGESYY